MNAKWPAACRRVLVTGGSGFVGKHLLAMLRRATDDGVEIFRAGHEGRTDVRFDLTDPPSVVAAVAETRPDLVFHLAGQASVAGADAAAAATWRVNLVGSLALAEALATVNPRATLLFASSAEVYGRAFLDGSVDETSVPQPTSVYAQVKLATEQMLMAVLPRSATVIVARPTNHIGPGQSDRFALASFAAQLAAGERAGARTTIQIGNLETRRDFMDVRDVVRAYLGLVSRYHGNEVREIFNIASEKTRTICSVLDMLRAASTVESEVRVDPERVRPAEIPETSADPSRLRAAIGWEPEWSLDRSVRDVLDDARARAATRTGGQR